MSTPLGFKKLWKNIDWTSKEEKLAFYNKYFKGSEFVAVDINNGIKHFRDKIIGFIDDGEIKEGDKTRDITIADIRKYVEGKE